MASLFVITRNVKGVKTFVSEASKPPVGAKISKGPVGLGCPKKTKSESIISATILSYSITVGELPKKI